MTENTGNNSAAEALDGLEFEDVRQGRTLEIINPSKLGDTRGVIATGRLARTVPNKYKPTKPSFVLETADGRDVLIDSAGNLGVQMAEVKIGDLVRIEYRGQQEIKSGAYKGKMAHNFNVQRAVATE